MLYKILLEDFSKFSYENLSLHRAKNMLKICVRSYCLAEGCLKKFTFQDNKITIYKLPRIKLKVSMTAK